MNEELCRKMIGFAAERGMSLDQLASFAKKAVAMIHLEREYRNILDEHFGDIENAYKKPELLAAELESLRRMRRNLTEPEPEV